MTARRCLVAVIALAAGLLIAPRAGAVGTTYYVDAVAGSDSAAGTTPAAAWRSLSKINATTFQPGDSILFNRGQTWAGQLYPKGSGTAAGGPITISSYGTGGRPKIDGSSLGGLGGAAVYFNNQEHWTIDGLEVVNNSGVDNLGTVTPGNHRSGIYFENGAGRVLSGFTIRNNYVHDVNGCFACNGYDAHANGAIILWANNFFDASSYDNILIEDNTVSYVGRVGIVVADWSTGYGPPPASYAVNHDALSTRVTVRNNAIDHIDGDGIIVWGAEGTLIERNVVGGAGLKTVATSTTPSSGGIWTAYTMDSTVQFNEVYGVKTQTTDGQGYDVDVVNINTKLQYNYSHDNEGGFLLMMGVGNGSHNVLVRENLSVNDAFPGIKGVFTFSYGISDKTTITNNTIYIPSGTPTKPIYCDSCDGTTAGDWSFRNNIVEHHGSGGYTYPNLAGAVFRNNVFFGNHPASEPTDPNKVTSDPLLVSPSGTAPYGIGSVAGYQVAVGSGAIGTGELQTQNGGVDYFGRIRSSTSAPTRGFHEAATFSGPATLQDGAIDFMASARHSSNVILDIATPANFNGDASRFARSNGSPAAVTWLFSGAQSFNATAYAANTTPAASVTFSASPNGRTFTSVSATCTAPVATAGGWSVSTCTPSSSLPTGTAFVTATISPPAPTLFQQLTGTVPAAQLGAMSITR